MTLPRTLLVALAASLPLMASLPANAAPQQTQRWIVRWASAAEAPLGMASTNHGHSPRTFSRAFPGAVLNLTKSQAESMRHNRHVRWIEPDVKVSVAGVQANPPAGLDRVDQTSAVPNKYFSNAFTGQGVRIYVVDTGLNLTHTDFTGRIVKGPNLADGGGAPTDCQGHGTHVAGIAAGTRMGVAKKATLVPVKVLDCNGEGYASDTITALEWVVANHAAGTPAVLNMSLTGPRSASLDAAVRSAIADGITVVTAAGNHRLGTSVDACTVSPNATAALTVGNAMATTSPVGTRLDPTSNTGRCVDLFAPGHGIVSDWIGSTTATATDTGSSMAAPFVAGAAALVLQASPRMTPAQVTSTVMGASMAGVVAGVPSGTTNRMLNTSSSVTPALIEKVGRPTLTGGTVTNRTMTIAPGSWGAAPVTLRYAWFRVDATGRRTQVTGATARTHPLVAADRGKRLVGRVTASAPRHRTVVAWTGNSAVVK